MQAAIFLLPMDPRMLLCSACCTCYSKLILVTASDDGHKIVQWTDFSKSLVGLEVFQLDVL